MNELYKLMRLCKIILPLLPRWLVAVRHGVECMRIRDSEASQDFPSQPVSSVWDPKCAGVGWCAQ